MRPACQPFQPPRARHRGARGLTLVEVLVASVILAIAGLAALELLASGDSASLFARRHALAATEAERALEEAATRVSEDRPAAFDETISQDDGGEPLAGCRIEVQEFREFKRIASGAGEKLRVPVVRLVAEVTAPDGTLLASIERLSPAGSAEVEP
jgi:prepilin-type N-terminal cleavage/methylation domain-containing protein